MHTRLLLYKRIASAPDDAALTLLEEEMVCCFGPLPPPAKDLFSATLPGGDTASLHALFDRIAAKDAA